MPLGRTPTSLLHRFRRPAPVGSCSRPRHRELTAAIRTIAAGEALLAPAITRRMIQDYVRRPTVRSRQPSRPGHVHPRELEVLTRIAHGRSNAEIGAALFLSEPTIKTHVTRILAKLQLRDRVQAVVVAYESGLIQPGIH